MIEPVTSLVPRVLRLFGLRVVARRDSGEFEKSHFFIGFPVTAFIVLPLKSRGNKIPVLPRVSPGNQPLAKEPEDSGYEIEQSPSRVTVQSRSSRVPGTGMAGKWYCQPNGSTLGREWRKVVKIRCQKHPFSTETTLVTVIVITIYIFDGKWRQNTDGTNAYEKPSFDFFSSPFVTTINDECHARMMVILSY